MSTVAEHDSTEHAVLLAESRDELVAVVGDRVVDAFLGGAVVIVLATPPHRQAIDERLRAAGVDVAGALRDGRLVAFDAAQTLARLAAGGEVDHAAVAEEMGAMLRTAAAAGPVYVFGEMVALLWEQGRVQEAIELESIWDRLIRQTPASLLCAYPGSLVDDPRHSAGLTAVCGLHSSVVADTPLDRTWRFGAALTSAPEARRLVANALRARGVAGQRLEEALVVVAEMVANALVHGHSSFSVRVRIDAAQVLLEVVDASGDVPVVRPLDSERPSGRGLHLLTALADRWGVERLPAGKLVWAELAR